MKSLQQQSHHHHILEHWQQTTMFESLWDPTGQELHRKSNPFLALCFPFDSLWYLRGALFAVTGKDHLSSLFNICILVIIYSSKFPHGFFKHLMCSLFPTFLPLPSLLIRHTTKSFLFHLLILLHLPELQQKGKSNYHYDSCGLQKENKIILYTTLCP